MRTTKGTKEKIDFIKTNDIDIKKLSTITGISEQAINGYIGNDGKTKRLQQNTLRKMIKGFNDFIKYHDDLISTKNKEIEDRDFLIRFISEQQNREVNNNE